MKSFQQTERTRRARRFSIGIARAAVIAAVYTGLCFATIPISYGLVQFRIAEALALLPLLMPEAVFGLTVGCLLANITSTPLDMGLGTLATFAAACITWLIGRLFKKNLPRVVLGCLPAILVNAFVVPVVLLALGVDYGYWACVGFVALGQVVCVVGLGIPLYFGVYQSLGFWKKRKKLPSPKNEERSCAARSGNAIGETVDDDGFCAEVEVEKPQSRVDCVDGDRSACDSDAQAAKNM